MGSAADRGLMVPQGSVWEKRNNNQALGEGTCPYSPSDSSGREERASEPISGGRPLDGLGSSLEGRSEALVLWGWRSWGSSRPLARPSSYLVRDLRGGGL